MRKFISGLGSISPKAMFLRRMVFGIGGVLLIGATVQYAILLQNWVLLAIAIGCATSGLALGYTLGDEHARRG